MGYFEGDVLQRAKSHVVDLYEKLFSLRQDGRSLSHYYFS